MNFTSKELDSYAKEFYGLLRTQRVSITFTREEVYAEADRQLSEETRSLVFRTTPRSEYDFASQSETFVVEYTECCRICCPDRLDGLAEFCDLLKAIGGYRSFRFRGSDGHWYVQWNPEATDEGGQWIKGIYIDG